MKYFKLALIHFDIKPKKPLRNRESLLEQIKSAAHKGAEFVVAPELCISGYSFQSRKDMLDCAETDTGPTLAAISDAARSYGIFICIGMAELDNITGILYNSAFVLDPSGNLICKYRKITAEGRWACSGDPKQDNTFETPWGRVGILICSDTYHSLMPRVTALRGADLLICPSNWPPTGLNPCELWRARAFENGFYLAACNRTGIDLKMDCRESSSCVVDPYGTVLLEDQSSESRIFLVDIPCDNRGKIEKQTRKSRMSERRPQYYYDCCLNLQPIRDLTRYLELPDPDLLGISCIVPAEGENAADAFTSMVPEDNRALEKLYILPNSFYSNTDLDAISRTAEDNNTGVVLCCTKGKGNQTFLFIDKSGARSGDFRFQFLDNDVEIPFVDFGPARIALMSSGSWIHPELAVAYSKKGCDLAVVFEDSFSSKLCLMAGARTIENMAVALCSKIGAGIWRPGEGHQRWHENTAGPGEVCADTLDTGNIRSKRFHDRVDFDLLFQPLN